MSNRSALLDHYELGGSRVAEIFHFDEETGTAAIEQREDVTGLIEATKAAADNPAGLRADGMRLEAHVPLAVLNQAFLEGWFHDKAAWKRWCNDPQNRAFRVEYNGRVKVL